MAFTTTDTDIVYTGNGADTTFAIPFNFAEETTIIAQLYDITDPANPVQVTPFDRNAEWSVVGTDVVVVTPPTTDEQVLIFRESPSIHDIVYSTLEFPFNTVNIDFDAIYRKVQEIEQNLLRAVLEDRFLVSSGAATPPTAGALTADVAANTAGVAANAANIATNAANITSNDGDITSLDGRVTALETAPPSAAPVDSVFGRTGVVVAASGDYTADQITQTLTREFITPAEKTQIATNDTDIDGLDTRVTALEGAPPGGGNNFTVTNVAVAGTIAASSFDAIIVKINGVTVDLPAAPVVNNMVKVKLRTGTSVTIDGNGNTIDGSATLVITSPLGAVELIYDGVEWVQL